MSADKRWLHRSQRWVSPGALFDARAFAVDVIPDDRPAERFVVEHHYAGSYPAARFRVGLFGPHSQLLGVAVFSEPASTAVLPKWLGGVADDGCELGRFVCLPEVAYNGETWFLARAFRLLRSEKRIRAVLSFADPVAWRNGPEVVKPEHWGTIYQASNAIHAGRSGARTHLVAPDGRPISPRALSKLRSEERGWEYVARQLVAAGAPRRAFGESSHDWLARVRATPGFTRQRHQGNLAYVFGLDAGARSQLTAQHGRGLAYPKAVAA